MVPTNQGRQDLIINRDICSEWLAGLGPDSGEPAGRRCLTTRCERAEKPWTLVCGPARLFLPGCRGPGSREVVARSPHTPLGWNGACPKVAMLVCPRPRSGLEQCLRRFLSRAQGVEIAP